MRTQRRTNFVWGLVALGAGLIVLLRAAGALPPGVFDLISRAWPVVLVLAGLSIILRPRVALGSWIALLLSGALVAGMAFSAYSTRVTQQRDNYREPVAQAIGETVTLLRLRVSTLASDIELLRSLGNERVVTGEFVGSLESVVTLAYDEDGVAATLSLEETQANALPLLENVGRGRLRLELPPDLPIDVEILGSSGAVQLNMSGLAVERMNLDLREGSAVVTLPIYQPLGTLRGESLGTLAVRQGDITLSIPQEVAARLELNRGGSGIEPVYDPDIYNFLVGDILEARTIDSAEIGLRYTVSAPRGRIRVQVPTDES